MYEQRTIIFDLPTPSCSPSTSSPPVPKPRDAMLTLSYVGRLSVRYDIAESYVTSPEVMGRERQNNKETEDFILSTTDKESGDFRTVKFTRGG